MKKRTPAGAGLILIAALILIIPLLLLSCSNKQAVPTQDEAKEAVWGKITAANDRWAAGDPMGFVDCAAPDVIWSDDLGAPNRVIGYETLKSYLETFKGQIPAHKHVLIDPVFQFYDDIVVVSYRYQGTFEEEVGAPWKVTSVYRYADGDWLSVHENWTEVKQ